MNGSDIKVFSLDKLYHTTMIYNYKTIKYYKEIEDDEEKIILPLFKKFVYPRYGEHPTKLDRPMWFTVNMDNSYLSPWMNHDQVILEYTVKKPLRLLDLRNLVHIRNRNEYLKYINTSDNIDGYIWLCDVEEIYLKKADDYLDPKYAVVYESANNNKKMVSILKKADDYL